MSEPHLEKLVYDCNVFLQFLFNPNGPSGECVRLALDGKIELFISDSVVAELRELPDKEFCLRQGITESIVDDFIAEIMLHSTFVPNVPWAFEHPIDPDDSGYVNLAIATGGALIVSRDSHLLNLTNALKPWSADFRRRFPDLRILQPPAYLAERAQRLQGGL